MVCGLGVYPSGWGGVVSLLVFVVVVVVAVGDDGLGDLSPSEIQAVLHGFEEPADGVAARGDLDVGAVAGDAVDDGEGLPALVVEILRDVEAALVAARAEGSAAAEGVEGACTACAVGGVPGEGFHDEELVVLGESGVGGGLGEVHRAVAREEGG